MSVHLSAREKGEKETLRVNVEKKNREERETDTVNRVQGTQHIRSLVAFGYLVCRPLLGRVT